MSEEGLRILWEWSLDQLRAARSREEKGLASKFVTAIGRQAGYNPEMVDQIILENTDDDRPTQWPAHSSGDECCCS